MYNIFDPTGLKFLTRLRLNFSHLREHKFRHNFQDTLNPLCSCINLETETTGHYLLRCVFYTNIRTTLLENLVEIVGNIENFSDDQLIFLLLYGDANYNTEKNNSILKNTINFLKESERFNDPLF